METSLRVFRAHRDDWFDSLLCAEIESIEEFGYVWEDYKCTAQSGFIAVCEDLWYNGVCEEFKDEIYLNYKDIFKH